MIGLIGKKIGMTQIFTDGGDLLPVTLLQVEPNLVLGKKTVEKDGYSAVIVGAFDIAEKKLNNPLKGFFKDIAPKRVVKEFRLDSTDAYEKGQTLGLEILQDAAYVDVSGYSKGKGFQGVMKRWGFGGGRATHGSKFHRQNGSTGQNTEPAKSIKGLKRAGHMGFEKKTTLNLKVVKVDAEKNIIAVYGSVPGTKNTDIVIRKAVKK